MKGSDEVQYRGSRAGEWGEICGKFPLKVSKPMNFERGYIATSHTAYNTRHGYKCVPVKVTILPFRSSMQKRWVFPFLPSYHPLLPPLLIPATQRAINANASQSVSHSFISACAKSIRPTRNGRRLTEPPFPSILFQGQHATSTAQRIRSCSSFSRGHTHFQ